MLVATAHAQAPMMLGQNGFSTAPIFTIGENYDGFFPPGLLDGMFAYERGDEVHLLVSHEFAAELGYSYELANGTSLTGARITNFIIDKVTRQIKDAGLAYDTIYNRAGEEVNDPTDLAHEGLDRFCSASGVEAGTSGFVDALYFAGEETASGSQFVLDVHNATLWAAPALGVGAWESASPLAIPSINDTHVALLMGDDRAGAPLYLYLGEKDLSPGAGFLERNGLAHGKLCMWKADDGATRPEEFAGDGNSKKGTFVEVENFNGDLAGQDGFDDLGYATRENLDAQRDALGAFGFSRPEDIHTNPYNGSQAVFASTGGVNTLDANGPAYDAADIWGTTYLIDVKISKGLLKKGRLGANLRILVDGDNGLDPAPPRVSFGDHPGLRSPDNLCWALDHKIYVQEDRASGFHVPGDIARPGHDCSIWQVHPHSGESLRVAEMNRVLPAGQFEGDYFGIPLALVLGIWESSGIIDVSTAFDEEPGSLFLFDVQAHSTFGGTIDSENLLEAGQILFLQKD